MATERCRVGALFSGVPHYYQRDTEQKRNGNWVAIPFFVDDPKLAAPMSETVARHFITKLQEKGMKNLWIEDCRDGRRIEVDGPPQPQVAEDTRSTARATLDDSNLPDARWYFVHPINRPDGAGQWFLKCTPPGFPNAQIIYAKEPLECLHRAQDLNLLQYGECAPAPEPERAPAPQNSNGWRRRPGDRYND